MADINEALHDPRQNFEGHKAQLGDWLQTISDERFGPRALTDLSEFAGLYGFEVTPVAEPPDFSKRREVALSLHETFVSMTALSPALAMDQKLEVLGMSAESMTNATHPVDGRRIILRNIAYWWRKTHTASTFNPAATSELPAHLFELGWQARRHIPKAGYGAMMKKIALAETGVATNSVLVALAALDSMPTDAQKQRAERHAQAADRYERTRQSRKAKKAFKRMNRAIEDIRNLQ